MNLVRFFNRLRGTRKKMAGVTLPEAMVATSVLALVIGTGFAATLRSYSLASEARFHDEARNIAASYVTQFQSLPYANTGVSGGYKPFFAPTGEDEAEAIANATGAGLEWDGVATVSSGPLVVPLFDGKTANVTRAVWEEADGALGPLLVAQFSVQFDSSMRPSFATVPTGVTVTVARAIVSNQ